MTNATWLAILKTICDLPTAPFCEEHVMAWIEQFIRTLSPPGTLTYVFDNAGNLRVDHVIEPETSGGTTGDRDGREDRRQLVFEAHVDHPGFISGEWIDQDTGLLRAEFLGGVKPSFFAGAGVRLFHPDGASPWTLATVEGIPERPANSDALTCVLKLRNRGIAVPVGTIGMWDLPDAALMGDLFAARVCDDLSGAAAMVCMLHAICERRICQPCTLLFTRGEEIGFLGALAAISDDTLLAGEQRKNCCVVGLENSRAMPQAAMGLGPVLRVGDRTSIFSSALTRFIKLTSDALADARPDYRCQRALMDGGTCDSTVFDAMGFDAAGITLPLANYHNMVAEDEALSCVPTVPRTGEKIGSEAIHVDDFFRLVELMVHLVERFHQYTGDHRGLQAQLGMRLTRHADRLYTSVKVHRKMEN